MNWLHYLLEANLYLTVFYIGYCLVLNKETYYSLNRAYLLTSCVLAFILPFTQLGILKHTGPVLQQVTMVNFTAIQLPVIKVVAAPVSTPLTLQDYVLYLYIAGAVMLLLVFLFKLYRLVKLADSKTAMGKQYKLVHLKDSDTAFSFFNYLFIGTNMPVADTIIKHELVHIRQKHSADIIFIELLKIINWFNPFIYLLQISLKAVHEYIADEKTANGTDVSTYSTFLVNNAYGISGSSITHSFFNYNLLKKRIIMLHQKRSGSLARLKYLMAVPLCAALLCVSTLAFSKTYGWIDLAPKKADTPRITPPPPPAPPVKVATPKVVHLTPPPPPAAPGKNVVIFPEPKNPSMVTSKGYKYAEACYKINGKTDYKVIIVDKDGTKKEWFKNSASVADIKTLHDKYGFTFMPIHQYEKMLPPPPPPAAPVKTVKFAPPVVVSDAPVKTVKFAPPAVVPDAPVKRVKFAAPVVVPDAPPVSAQNKMKPPPPPPFERAYKDFFEYLQKSISHSADTRKQHATGSVVAQYTLDANQHITDVEIISGDSRLTAIAIFAIKTYKGDIDKPAGNYKIGFDFNPSSVTNADEVRAKDAKMMAMPDFTGIISVVVNPAN